MTYYDASLLGVNEEGESSFSVEITAGSKLLHIQFDWDDTIKEQYNEYMDTLRVLSSSDPLVLNTGVVDRDYDYLDYYKNIPEDILQWLSTNPVLPSSLLPLSNEAKVSEIESRKETCVSMEETVNQYAELLTWYMTITIDEEIIQGRIFPNSVFSNLEGTVRVELYSEREHIDKEALQYVSLGIGVDDE